MTFTEKQARVLSEAKVRLKKYPWFSGVCLDNFPTDRDIDRDGFELSVSSVVEETAMWDAPDPLHW